MKRRIRMTAAWMLCVVLLGWSGQAYAGMGIQKTKLCDPDVQEKAVYAEQVKGEKIEPGEVQECIQADQTEEEEAGVEREEEELKEEQAKEEEPKEEQVEEEEPKEEQAKEEEPKEEQMKEEEPKEEQAKEEESKEEQVKEEGTKEEQMKEEEMKEEQVEEDGTKEQTEKEQEAEKIFYIQEHSPKITTRSFDNASMLPVSHVRYDHFQAIDSNTNTSVNPNLGMGMKYIEGDDKNVDGGGKWRYVYCLQFSKESPGNSAAMQYVGWANRKVAYALYYGAVYYGNPCRYSPYSTGNWRMDYFVTQVAVHILNNEFNMAAFQKGLNRSAATKAEKDLVYNRVNLMVNDANNAGNYGGFTSDGWLDMKTGSFSLSGYQDTWTLNGGKYLSGGIFHPVFKSYYGYNFCEQITKCEIQVPSGVSVRRESSKTYTDFDLEITENQYRQWQLTGKTIPVTVKITIPRYWGGGIYRCPGSSAIQDVCFLTWGAEGGTAVFTQTANLHIKKVTRELTVYKKDAESGEALLGAVFSLWAYDGSSYNKKVGNFQDQKDGSYVLKNIDYSSASDGMFLIKEEIPPVSYKSAYQPENDADAQDFKRYGGRTVKMNENGFFSDKVSKPFVFKDEKLIPQANISVMKYDIDTGKNLLGAEFAAYEWNSKSGRYGDQPVCTLIYDEIKQKYVTQKPVVKSEENGGKFLIRETKLPYGYYCGWSEEILVSEPGTVNLELTAPNYPGRNFTFIKKIRRDEINWEHGNPTFFFRLWGTDLDGVRHQYHCHVEFTPETSKNQDGEYFMQTAVIRDIPAGIYQAEEAGDVLRYTLTGAESADKNVLVKTASSGRVNGIEKITAQVTADLRTGDGSVLYENRKVLYDEFSDNAVAANHFVYQAVKTEE